MALAKTIELASGIQAQYTKILRLNISNDYETGRKQFHIDYALYKDQAAREANKTPIAVKTMVVETDLNYVHADARPALYALMKTTTEFTGATDV